MERNFRNFRFSRGGYFTMEHKDTKTQRFFILSSSVQTQSFSSSSLSLIIFESLCLCVQLNSFLHPFRWVEAGVLMDGSGASDVWKHRWGAISRRKALKGSIIRFKSP